MKKHAFMLATVLLVCPRLQAGSDGAAVAGALGGLAVGTMIGSAVASDSHKDSRAEQEAIRAQDKAEQVRSEQEKLAREMDRRDLERKLAESQTRSGDSMLMVLVGLIAILFLAVLGLGFVVLRKK
jgi:hypothetical protein